MWGALVLVSFGLIATLLDAGLTSEASLTNHPDSARAQELIDARLPDQRPGDEVIVVRSERSVVSDPAYVALIGPTPVAPAEMTLRAQPATRKMSER